LNDALLSRFSLLGKEDLNEIAEEDGLANEDEEEVDEESFGEEPFESLDVASKFVRVLHQEEANSFVIFIELGVTDREIQLMIVNEHSQIELSYKVPAPPDELFQAAGLHATLVDTEETFEVFYFTPSKRLTGAHEELFYPKTKPG
jgi:hypothetical protein